MPRLKRQKLRPDGQFETERGVAALELVIVVPVLIVLFLGIVEFGRYYNASINVTHAAREGVRRVALYDSASAEQKAKDAALPVLVSLVSMAPCPSSGIGDASITIRSSFTFDPLLVGLGSRPITRTAVMRCGG